MKKINNDPYVNEQTGTLKNLLGISDREKLNKAEAKITGIAIGKLSRIPIKGDFDFTHLCKIHEKIFDKIYEWAGCQRTINIEKPEEALGGLSVEYTECDEIQREASIILSKMREIPWDKLTLEQKSVEFSQCMAGLWKVHPFREGNTRTTITFCCDFADSRGFGLNRQLFKDNSQYMRRALVAASAKFTDLGDLSKPEFLRRIIKDGLEQGELERQKEAEQDRGNKRESMADYVKEIAKEKAKDGIMKLDVGKDISKTVKER